MPDRFRAHAFALLLAAASPAVAQPLEPIDVDAEIVLAVDASRSMDLDEFAVQRDGYLQALRHPDFARAVAAGRLGRVAIAYFEWSGQVQDSGLIPWRLIDGPGAAAALADEIAAMPVERSRGTSIARAIAFATVLIEDDLVVGARRIIDVSGDGANNTGPPVTEARDAAVARDITINGLPVMAFPGGALADLDTYYQDCVIGGLGAFVMVARTGEELAATIRRKLIVEVSGLAPPMSAIPVDFHQPTDCLIGEKRYRQRYWDGR
ncbi:MAG TPA: DUF1194 domain-containing protein [Reyranella sp.]|nr:DUF1194 domain-containing protein [Reyranella sp.]